MFFFAVKLRVLPPYGRQDATSIILPALSLGWFFVAANLRLVRSGMLEVLDSEYIKLARAKGVPSRLIIWKHGLRNALIPAITYAGVTLGGLVTGSVVVETVFAWPGLGQLAVQALFNNDYPLLQGVVIIFTFMYVLASPLVDVLYSYIDPRSVMHSMLGPPLLRPEVVRVHKGGQDGKRRCRENPSRPCACPGQGGPDPVAVPQGACYTSDDPYPFHRGRRRSAMDCAP
jgi:peptide/nickel transport system permease protein